MVDIKETTMAERLHEAFRVIDAVEETIMKAYEKYEPQIADRLDFKIMSDDYDNSLEIHIETLLSYPYEPCIEIRKEIYALGFSTVYWNFYNEGKYADEIRGYEPRHSKHSSKWMPTEYGYVDERFVESEWKSKYLRK